MKTIAVLTDFSEQSAHATRYALHLAKKINAGLILYNLTANDTARKPVLQRAWQENGDWELQNENTNSLIIFGARLEAELMQKSLPGTSLPYIAYDTENQEIVDVMTSIVNNDDIMLIVTAPLPDQDMATFMTSDNCRKIVDWASVPVLVVPETASIRNPEKIAFAANLADNDTDYLNALVNLVDPFASEIMVTSLNAPGYEHHKSENTLKKNIHDLVDYGRIYYRNISDSKSMQGWKWLKENKKCDMLAMVKQPQQTLKTFFTIGNTREITHHLIIPLLIFPEI